VWERVGDDVRVDAQQTLALGDGIEVDAVAQQDRQHFRTTYCMLRVMDKAVKRLGKSRLSDETATDDAA